MASPLHLFRKYQYAFLVGFGILLMFSFVIAPPLMDYLQSQPGAAGSGNAVVVTWKAGELNEVEIDRLRVNHILTTRFLNSLVQRVEVVEEATVDLKGEPITLIKGRSFPVNGQTASGYQIVIDGTPVQVPSSAVRPISPKVNLIPPANSEEELVNRMILAQKAKDMGVVIGEDAIIDYLDNLVDASSENRPNYAALLQAATGGKLDINQFFQQMVFELSAQRLTLMAQSGLYTVSPEKLYECYNRLHRRVTAELLAVDVSEFVKDVPDPAADAVLALYEEGKNRYPDPFAADPGFKRRQRISFGYFKGDFEQFVAREVEQILPTITNEQIEKYYEDNKATRYTVPDLPADAPATPPAAGATPPTTPAAPENGTPAPETTPSTPDGTTTPAPAAPSGEAPAPAPPTAEPAPPAEPAPTEPAPTEPAPATPTPPPTTPDPATPPAEEGKQLSQNSRDAAGLTFVSLAAQEPAPQDPAPVPQADPAAPPAEPTTPPAEPTTSPTETPAPPADPATPPVEPAATPTAPAMPATPPATPPAAPPDTPATPAPPTAAGQAPAETPAAPAGDKPAPKPVQYKPLDDALRTEIRQELARTAAHIPAQEKLDKAANAVRQAMEEYSKQLSRIKGVEGAAKPTPPDFAALAKENFLTYEKTPLWDMLDVFQIQQAVPTEKDPASYDIVRANETMFSQQSGMMRRSLINVGFTGDVALFMPRRLIDGFLAGDQFEIPPEKLFIYWREEVIPEAVPPLEEIREEVVRAWKMKQALPLARAKAEQLAKQAGEAGKPLSEVFADNAAKVIKSNPFTWMTRGAMPGSTSGGATLSTVSGKAGEEAVTISGAGDDFMRAVFDLKPGLVGVAVNQPESFVYVVRVDSEEPNDEVRRDEFFKSGMTMEVLELVRGDQQMIYTDWISSLVKENQISWKREAHRNWNVE